MPRNDELRRLAAALEDLNEAVADRWLSHDNARQLADVLDRVNEATTMRDLRHVVLNAAQFHRRGDHRRLEEYRRQYVSYCAWAASLLGAAGPLTPSLRAERERRLHPLLELRRQLVEGAHRDGRLRPLPAKADTGPRAEIGRDVDLDTRKGNGVA